MIKMGSAVVYPTRPAAILHQPSDSTAKSRSYALSAERRKGKQCTGQSSATPSLMWQQQLQWQKHHQQPASVRHVDDAHAESSKRRVLLEHGTYRKYLGYQSLEKHCYSPRGAGGGGWIHILLLQEARKHPGQEDAEAK